MSDKGEETGTSPPIGRVGRTLLGLEQLLYACIGYALAQLPVLFLYSDPEDADYIIFGITGALAGVLLHVLVRGMGMKIPGLAARSDRDAETTASSRKRRGPYRKALALFRRSGAKGDEPPGNPDRIVETGKGFRVGDREFPSRSEAEDYLYVESASDRQAARRRKQHSEGRKLPRISAAKARRLNSLALGVVVGVFALLILLAFF